MKNILLASNLLLATAVGVLFYFHFSDQKADVATAGKKDEKMAEILSKPLPASFAGKRILYINIDTLNIRYEGLKELKKRIDANENSFKSRYETEVSRFETDYADYQKKASTGILPQDQMMKLGQDLQKRRDDILEMENRQKKVLETFGNENDKITKDVYAFMKEYSKGKELDYILAYTSSLDLILYSNDSLNITNEAIDLLNKRYREKKNQKTN